MKQVVINIKENKYNFIMELLNSFDFVKVADNKGKPLKLSAKQKEFVDDLKHSLNEVELHRQGKIKLQSAREFLNEL